MKRIITTLTAAVLLAVAACSASPKPEKLPAPNKERPATLMQALSDRKSTRTYAKRALSRQDLGDMLWAANGVNRPDGKRTAPSAMNKQDIKIYVIDAEGSYLYDATDHSLVPIAEGDFRQKVRGTTPAANLVLVADTDSRWAMIDAGYVSQNIYLFCAANSMATVACGSMDQEAVRKALNLAEGQMIAVQHPVGYIK